MVPDDILALQYIGLAIFWRCKASEVHPSDIENFQHF